jgi:hypothetical protein
MIGESEGVTVPALNNRARERTWVTSRASRFPGEKESENYEISAG